MQHNCTSAGYIFRYIFDNHQHDFARVCLDFLRFHLLIPGALILAATTIRATACQQSMAEYKGLNDNSLAPSSLELLVAIPVHMVAVRQQCSVQAMWARWRSLWYFVLHSAAAVAC